MPGTATKVPFANASPAELRDAILPEDREAFDQQLRAALDAVGRTLRLDELDAFLASWRQLAWAQTAHGHDGWRDMLAKADRIQATGQPEPGSRPWEEVRAELGL